MGLDFGDPPPLRPTDIALRAYQTEAIDAVREQFQKRIRSTLLVMATGLGKTVTFGSIARMVAERGGRTLILAHRGELIDQAVETLTRLGLDPAVEKAGSFARSLYDPHAVVATVQTLQRKRLESWPKDYFKLVVCDEAHHSTAQSYRNIFSHFDALKLGVTATADRADEESLTEIYQTVAYEYSLWDAMTAEAPGPYLSRLKFVQCDVGIDLRDIRTTAGDLNAGDLEEAIRPHIDTLANAIRQEAGTRKTLVFTPDVGSAQAMASALSSIGVSSRWVAGDSKDRREIIEGYKRSEYQALVNCMLCTEGFDVPDIAAVAFCRPTKSRPLFAQMAGRGTRLAHGKSDCLLIDFAWLTGKHELVKPLELFDTTTTDTETLDIAEAIIKKNADVGLDLKDVIEVAKAEQKRRTVLRIQARERKLKYRRVAYDPLSAMETLGVPVRKEAAAHQGTITDKQRQTLERWGFTGLESCSKRRASMLIDAYLPRVQKGLATHKQVGWLIKDGVDAEVARAMTKQEASAELDRRWGKKEVPVLT